MGHANLRTRSAKRARLAPSTVNQAGASSEPKAEIDGFCGDPNFMMSLARGLAVIQAFSARKQQLTISHVSNKTGFSRAAVRRCLYTLAQLGFAGSDDGRHFFLRPRVLTLGHSYISSMPLAAAAQPVLEHVSRLLHESCSIAALDGVDIVYIARVNVTRIMSIDLDVGSRLPAYCTSMGRVLLANLPPEELESYLSHAVLTRRTDRTIVSAKKLKQVLRQIRSDGYSVVDQELEHGLRSMAVPIQNTAGRVTGAINVGTHSQRVSIQDMINKFLPHLQAAAQELAMLLK